jgi:hypothetical protein
MSIWFNSTQITTKLALSDFAAMEVDGGSGNMDEAFGTAVVNC